MTKGYQVIEPVELLPIITFGVHHPFAVAIFSWLIQQLEQELGSKLDDVEIEIIPFVHHHPSNGYPLLGIHYPKGLANSENLEPVIVSTISKILNGKNIVDLINFVGSNNTDWGKVADGIMK